MLPDSTQQLILKLWDLTARGVIPWGPGEDEDEHQFETEAYVVAIRGDPARVRILRPDGRTVEEANAAMLSATGWPHPDLARFDAAVSELASRAAKVSSGGIKPVRTAMSSLSAPTRTPRQPPLAKRPDRAMFGAIASFDRSGPNHLGSQRRNEPPEGDTSQSEPSRSEPPPRNVYSPWIT